MSILKRFAFYFGGFAIGIVLLFFFIGGSGASCEFDYTPNARVLKNIRNKDRTLNLKSLTTLKENQLDTSLVSLALINGKVLFSKSNTSLDSCKIYQIEFPVATELTSKLVYLTIENCDKKAIVQKIEIKK
ncbi:MAG: hypothetical protein HON09_03640 [Flavobacteriaceae bacterium]|jgi:hypothetical protein|nr:hypothetical protein [Flavobacteriaceae bacterium]MDG1328258.1 hypothetical protein [Flavobacteriaceae bacterium]MDG2446748.1 hypothetical protein [Flavobacteriaceae bacterium]